MSVNALSLPVWEARTNFGVFSFAAANQKTANAMMALLFGGRVAAAAISGAMVTPAAPGLIRRTNDGARDSSLLIEALQRAMKSEDVAMALWSLLPFAAELRAPVFAEIGFPFMSTAESDLTKSLEKIYHRTFAVCIERRVSDQAVAVLTVAFTLAAVIAKTCTEARALATPPPVDQRVRFELTKRDDAPA